MNTNVVSIKNREDIEILNELVSLQKQVKVRLQDKLGEQNYHQTTHNLFEPVTDAIKNTSENSAGNSIKNNLALENLNDKLLEILNDRGKIAFYLMSPLSKTTNPENAPQFKLVKDSNSNRVNEFQIDNTISISLYNSLLTSRCTGKKFELKGELLKMITNNKYKVHLASLSDKKYCMILQKEVNFDVKGPGNKSI